MSVSSSLFSSLSHVGIHCETNQGWVDKLKLLTKKQALAMLATVPPQPNKTHIYFILRKPTHSKRYYKLADMALYNKKQWPGVDVDVSCEKMTFDPKLDQFCIENKRFYSHFNSFLNRQMMSHKLICRLEKLLNELMGFAWYIDMKEIEEANQKMKDSECDLFYVVNESNKDSFPVFTVVSKHSGDCRTFYVALSRRGGLICWDQDHNVQGVYKSFAEFCKELKINGPIHEASYSKLSPRMLQVANHEPLSASDPR